MTCPNGLSGQDGRVLVGSCNLSELTAWDLDIDANVQQWFPASAGGWAKAIAGPKSGSGSFTVAVSDEDTTQENFSEGDCVTLYLYHNTDGSVQHSGSAVISGVSTGADLSGPVQMMTYRFTTTGAWTHTGF
jgi:hypothetical protein